MKNTISCPNCGTAVAVYRNPIPTTDIIIEIGEFIVLIRRKNPPFGWALPGGFVDYGESVESAALREAKEETSLDVTNLTLFNVYSAPDRDPRHHTISVVFTAQAAGTPEAGDDAAELGLFKCETLPSPLVFDHGRIVCDYFAAVEKRKDTRT